MEEESIDAASLVPLGRRVFARPAEQVARALLGRLLVHQSPQGLTAGIIVETEAYDENDPASHSSHGRTPRNRVMFESGGFAYVYRSYGMHWCVNVSAGRRGFGAAVLLRALQPVAGEALMAQRRGFGARPYARRDLARGPGRLTQAMAIDGSHDGHDLLQPPLFIAAAPGGAARPEIVTSPRVGISKAVNVPWRFFIRNNAFVSGSRFVRARRRRQH